MNDTQLRIGTRGSPLALAQARLVARLLAKAHPGMAPAEIVIIKTTGDAVQDRALAEIGGKGLFTKEIEQALLAGTIDLAVHSMKDVETRLPDGLVIDCILEREDPRDVLLCAPSVKAASIAALPKGASLGTSSLRRSAQALALRPDLMIVPLRGNVGTRLVKLERGEATATLLACAGLRRLALDPPGAALLPVAEMLPAVAQGAIGIERRADDARINSILAPLDHAPSRAEVTAERAFLAALGGSCRTPIAALARVTGDRIALDGLLVNPDGSGLRRSARAGSVADSVAIGRAAGEALRGAS
ncbi:MAG: hydroxymethylbilane synthase [Alphaproteobacteria bacterium]|nr:hydroxymethylbilane synthase [Alphaproteobacteria bacterium]